MTSSAHDRGPKRPSEPSSSESGVRPLPAEAKPDIFDPRTWDELDAVFEQDPFAALQEADELVRKQIHALVNRLTKHHSRLRLRWDGHEQPSVDELRACLREYRALAERLAEEVRGG